MMPKTFWLAITTAALVGGSVGLPTSMPQAAAAGVLNISNANFEFADGWEYRDAKREQDPLVGRYSKMGSHSAKTWSTNGMISQSLTAGAEGRFLLTFWANTKGHNGYATVSINGRQQARADIVANGRYQLYSLPFTSPTEDSVLRIEVHGPDASMNVDYFRVAPGNSSILTVSSDNAQLKEMADWAIQKAGSFAVQPGEIGRINMDENQRWGSGDATYARTYWAGYTFRSGVYARDFAHQVDGAQLVGLAEANFQTLKAFAKTQTAARGFYPVWALNFDFSPLTTDYKSDTRMVKEVPAMFELVERAYDAYTWTGDRRYLTDPDLVKMYDSVSSFVAAHDKRIPNGIAEGDGDLWAGSSTYTESGTGNPHEAADGFGSQYAAYRALAALSAARGKAGEAAHWTNAAQTLKDYFNTTWSVDPANPSSVIGARWQGGGTQGGWQKEPTMFIGTKGLLNPGPRRDAFVGDLTSYALNEPQRNIESQTYLPDAFFALGRPDTAWAWMSKIYAARASNHPADHVNGDYPEVSFTLIDQVTRGIAGVDTDAAGKTVSTVAQLPSGTNYVDIENIPFAGASFDIRHDGGTSSTLTNNSGDTPLTWTARFAGSRHVADPALPTKIVVIDGRTYTEVQLVIPPRESRNVHVC